MKYFNYLLLVIGAIIAMYAKGREQQNQYILIVGIVILMIGIYRIAKTIPSRTKSEDDTNV